MSASLVGSPLNVSEGGSYTAETGSSRVVVITVGTEEVSGAGALSLSALSFGTASLANGKVISGKETVNTGAQKAISGVWYIKEADIPAGSNVVSATFSVAESGTGHVFTLYTLDGVDQSNPIDSTSSFSLNIGSEADPWSSNLTVVNNAVQILCAIVHTNAPSTPSGSWVEDRDNSRSNYQFVSQHLTGASAGSVTYGLDFVAAQAGVVAVVSFNPAPVSTGRMMMMGVG